MDLITGMAGAMAENVTEFLNRKRGEKIAALRRSYSIREFADDIGLDDSTLGRLMNHKVKFSGLEAETFQALYRAFGDEFLRVLGVDPSAEPTFTLEDKPTLAGERGP